LWAVLLPSCPSLYLDKAVFRDVPDGKIPCFLVIGIGFGQKYELLRLKSTFFIASKQHPAAGRIFFWLSLAFLCLLGIHSFIFKGSAAAALFSKGLDSPVPAG